MKIIDVKATPVAMPLKTPLLHAWGIHPGFGRLIVQVFTDEGIVGLGECSRLRASPRRDLIPKSHRPR